MRRVLRCLAVSSFVSGFLLASPWAAVATIPAGVSLFQDSASAGRALLDKLDGFFEGLMKGAMAPNAAVVALDGFKAEAEQARVRNAVLPGFFKRYTRIVRTIWLVTATNPDDDKAAENEAEIGRFVTDIIGGAWSADLSVSEKIGKLSEAVAGEIAALRLALLKGEDAAPAPPAEPVRVAGSEAPKQIKDVKPVYPAAAHAARVEGIVILEAVIDIKGNVGGVKLIRSIPLLDQAAIDAVKQWKYEPPHVDGKATEVVMTVTVTFTLK